MTAPPVIRRRSRTALVLLFAAMAALGLAACSSGHKDKTSRHRSATKPPAPARLPAVEAGLLPWRLSEPLSREVVVPPRGKRDLLVLGGLDAHGSSAAGVGS